jgi:hypothetical protein
VRAYRFIFERGVCVGGFVINIKIWEVIVF